MTVQAIQRVFSKYRPKAKNKEPPSYSSFTSCPRTKRWIRRERLARREPPELSRVHSLWKISSDSELGLRFCTPGSEEEKSGLEQWWSLTVGSSSSSAMPPASLHRSAASLPAGFTISSASLPVTRRAGRGLVGRLVGEGSRSITADAGGV